MTIVPSVADEDAGCADYRHWGNEARRGIHRQFDLSEAAVRPRRRIADVVRRSAHDDRSRTSMKDRCLPADGSGIRRRFSSFESTSGFAVTTTGSRCCPMRMLSATVAHDGAFLALWIRLSRRASTWIGDGSIVAFGEMISGGFNTKTSNHGRCGTTRNRTGFCEAMRSKSCARHDVLRICPVRSLAPRPKCTGSWGQDCSCYEQDLKKRDFEQNATNETKGKSPAGFCGWTNRGRDLRSAGPFLRLLARTDLGFVCHRVIQDQPT